MPEPTRTRAPIWILAALAFVAACVVAGAAYLRHVVNDASVPQSTALLPPGAPPRVMAVWAHPDDEITSAGTLAALARADAHVTLVYFTHGEASSAPGYTRQRLWEDRPHEATAAAARLGARAIRVFDFGDGKLAASDGRTARAELRALIDRVRPSIVIGFDERVGFYGHPDHLQVGRWTAQVVREGQREPGFPVKRLYQATLPAPMVALALRLIDAFREHYPTAPGAGLPAPTVAVPIFADATPSAHCSTSTKARRCRSTTSSPSAARFRPGSIIAC